MYRLLKLTVIKDNTQNNRLHIKVLKSKISNNRYRLFVLINAFISECVESLVYSNDDFIKHKETNFLITTLY